MAVTQPFLLFAPCAPGLEPLLLAEVRAVGGVRPKEVPGGVEMEANEHVLGRCLLELGLAIDVRVRLGTFYAPSFDAVIDETSKLDWNRLIGPGQGVEIRASARRSRLMHTGALEQRVYQGIKNAVGSLASSESEAPWRVFARNEKDRMSLSLSLAGEALHRRGYRLVTGKAPLREDLARALLQLSGWDPTTKLLDPFCGSGTILIEGARWARRIPPGWNRSFHLERSPIFDPDRWKKIRDRLEGEILEAAPAPIAGGDRDPGALDATRQNAERAGVELELEQAPLGKASCIEKLAGGTGMWVSNPPFGVRVQGGPGLRPLYQTIGNRFAELGEDWRLGLLVHDPKLAHATGLPLESRALLDHGGRKTRVFASPTR